MLIFGNVLNGNCCLMTRKIPKAKGKIGPKILLEKNKERENGKSEEKTKKSNGCALSFYVDFFERN